MEDKKIIMEKNGKSEEISKDKLEEIKSSPDFMVTTIKENNNETRVNVKQRLYD